jgi:hypothetical protein
LLKVVSVVTLAQLFSPPSSLETPHVQTPQGLFLQ